ncbi:MAG: UDP-N-acetylmuramoyl-L-alanyl-D-glutamate--2,6-diaminopimelate ligase [bacterium]
MTERALATLRDALGVAGLLTGERGPLPTSIESITDDSRAVGRGTLFLAVRGAERDGHAYLDRAAAQGAVAAIVDDASRTALPALIVSDTRRAAAVVAAAFFGEPAKGLHLVGVTGTNGKTTTVGMLRHLLDVVPGSAASIGTLGVLVGSAGTPLEGGSGLTTPGPVELQRVLRELYDRGVRIVAMETSSHALHQRRVEGLTFDAGVFTNLTRDHLDYHVTMEAYLAAKALLVAQIAEGGAAVVNADDPAWRALPPAPRTVSYGTTPNADVSVSDIRCLPDGSTFVMTMGGTSHRVTLPLIGDFNVTNALAAAACAWSIGCAPDEIVARLATMPQVPGRLEIVHARPTVLRDYAHTPDALERAIGAVRPFAPGRVIVVFGCGGDRDRGKRPEMGRIAVAGADVAIVTSDNPRTEDPERILDDVEAGMGSAPHERIEDRRAAIARALELAGLDDLVLLAGKGHETYQIRGTTKLPFDERQIVREIFTEQVT